MRTNSPIIFASFGSRCLAGILDLIVLWMVTTMIDSLFSPVSIAAHIGMFLSDFLVGVIYTVYFQAKYSGTIGKRLVGIKLVDESTLQEVSNQQAMKRYLLSSLSYICLGLGIFCIISRPKKQSWHDSAAKTLVVKKNVELFR